MKIAALLAILNLFISLLYSCFEGQLQEIAAEIYNIDNLNIRIIDSQTHLNESGATTSAGVKPFLVKYRLDFDNRDYVRF